MKLRARASPPVGCESGDGTNLCSSTSRGPAMTARSRRDRASWPGVWIGAAPWALAALPGVAACERARRVSSRVPGCTLELPAARGTHGAPDRKLPLLVVLHGDREHARAAAARWRGAAKQRGWAVLALECPVDHGCKDSWWKWNGDPAWVVDQVAAGREGGADRSGADLPGGLVGGRDVHRDACPELERGIRGGGVPRRWSSAECRLPGAPRCRRTSWPATGIRFTIGSRICAAWFDDCRQDVVVGPRARRRSRPRGPRARPPEGAGDPRLASPAARATPAARPRARRPRAPPG